MSRKINRIKWSDSYILGFPEIDEDHRQLFLDINSIIDAVNQNDCDMCKELSENFVVSLKEHFPKEEEFLRKLGYSHFKKHSGHHDILRHKAELLSLLCRKGESHELIKNSLSGLITALLEDIRGGDLHFRSYMIEKSLNQTRS